MQEYLADNGDCLQAAQLTKQEDRAQRPQQKEREPEQHHQRDLATASACQRSRYHGGTNLLPAQACKRLNMHQAIQKRNAFDFTNTDRFRRPWSRASGSTIAS